MRATHARILLTAPLLLLSACGFFTLRAEKVVLSSSLRDLDCADVTVVRANDGTYRATGCGRTKSYACDREVATGFSKPGALASIGCRSLAAPIAEPTDAGSPTPN